MCGRNEFRCVVYIRFVLRWNCPSATGSHAEKVWSPKSAEKLRLNESSARILHSKALPLVAEKSAHIAVDAEFARLERRDELLSNWHRLVLQSRLSVIRETFKEHQNAKNRAARNFQERRASLLDKLRLSRSDYLLPPMTLHQDPQQTARCRCCAK